MIDYEAEKYIYRPTVTLQEIIRDLYQKKVDICLVCGERKHLDGIITLGDIKQAIISGLDPTSLISEVVNRKFVSAREDTALPVLAAMSKMPSGIRMIPIVNSGGEVVGIYPKEAQKNLKHRTVLVTGGAGYVGSLVCRRLLARGYRVVVLDNLSFGQESIADLMPNANFQLIVGDIGNINHLIQGIKQADHVIHLAGTVGDPASALDPTYTMESNYFSTQTLVELSKHYQVSHFIFASSCSVYGASNDILTERSPLNPVSLYARTKIAAEKKLLESSDPYFNPIILRFGTLYGLSPRMRFDLVVNLMSAHAFFLKKILISGGDQWRPLLHVDDAAEACVQALEMPLDSVRRQIFNVGSNDENYKIKDIARLIKKQLPQVNIISQDAAADLRNYRVSFNKIFQKFNFCTNYNLEKGISELIKSMQDGRFHNYADARYNNYLRRKESI